MSEDAGELVADAIVDYVNDLQRSYSFEFTATNPTDPTTALQLDSDGNAVSYTHLTLPTIYSV